jgi:hypothetical protein
LDILLGIDELDAKRHVLSGVYSTFLRMDSVVRAEARFRTQHGCAGDALLEK